MSESESESESGGGNKPLKASQIVTSHTALCFYPLMKYNFKFTVSLLPISADISDILACDNTVDVTNTNYTDDRELTLDNVEAAIGISEA